MLTSTINKRRQFEIVVFACWTPNAINPPKAPDIEAKEKYKARRRPISRLV
jgi:ABC-type proline/glycine betaine transport system substrate-binding protein